MSNNNDNYKLFKKKIKSEVINNNFIFIDIDEEFRKSGLDPKKYYPFEKYGHLNEKGYNFISKIILKTIDY